MQPQPLGVVLSVRFDPASARRLAQLAGATGRTPSRLIRDWTLERLGMGSSGEPPRLAGIREGSASYGVEDPDEYEELRQRYRPPRIRLLLVGESRPAGGRFFYLANSNLYYATLDAWQNGPGPVASGETFLDTLKAEGIWLYDLSAAPVNRLRGRPRQQAVRERTTELEELLASEMPDTVVVVKRSLDAVVREAARGAGIPSDRLDVLPFPLYQWRTAYVEQLGEIFRHHAATRRDRPTAPPEGVARSAERVGMTRDVMRPEMLARDIGISAKVLRAWLRRTYPRRPTDHRQPWFLTRQQVVAARAHFGGRKVS
jgi:predicted transcriptional regulator